MLATTLAKLLSYENSSNYFYQDSIKEENDEPNFHELKSNLIIKKKKVGRKRKLDYEDNHKITNDNMIRKCKHLVIKNCIEFLNFQIKKIYHNNIMGPTIRPNSISYWCRRTFWCFCINN